MELTELALPSAGLLAAGIAFAPAAFPLFKSHELHAGSFSGGVAVAYVFLQLLPELDKGHALLGEAIYVVSLFGFMIFYGLEHISLSKNPAKEELEANKSLTARAFVTALYLLGVSYSMVEEFPETIFGALVLVGGLATHIGTTVFGLEEVFGERYVRIRYLFAFTVLVGGAAGYALSLHEAIIDILTALTAGFVMFTCFREELLGADRTRFPWFVAGVFSGNIALLL